jgi:hypothetical protein
MKKLFLSGTIHPERAGLTIKNLENEFVSPDGKIVGRLKFNITNNQVTALIESENERENIYTLRNYTKACVEFVTNLMGFIKGYAYDVEITKVFDDKLDHYFVFGIGIPALEKRNKDRDVSTAMPHIYPLCFGSDGVYLRRCLEDLNMAIKRPDDTPFHCFRAIESLRQYFGFVDGIADDHKQWKAMAKAIGGKREDLEPIRKLAFPARHGVPNPITDQERKDIFFLTWNIVERVIDYRLKKSGASYRLQPTDKDQEKSSDKSAAPESKDE